MKPTILLITLLFAFNVSSQKTFRIFAGANVSNTNFHRVDHATQTDSFGLRRTDYILPFIGADIEYLIKNKFTFSSGLGVSWMGSKDYQQGIPDIYKVDTHLRLGYIRIPFIINYEFIKKIKLSCGYSFNYNFRKNQQFYSFNDKTLELIDIYQPFHHAVNIGLRKDIGNWNILLNYHKGISRIYDTKSHHQDYRIFLTLGGLQLTIGYLIDE